MTRRTFGRGFGIGSILLLVAVVCFLLAAFGANLGELRLLELGLAAFAASFFVG
jgi:hypothetical protein